VAFEVLNRCKHRLAVSVIVGRRRHATIILSIIQKKN